MTSAGAGSQLDVLIEQTVIDLQAATQGGSLCALTRSGRSAPAAKYHEGRWAALTELRRLERQSEALADALRDRWLADLQLLLGRDADVNWVAYTQGGVDALTQVRGDDVAWSS
ncbi:MAG: hypothetical protein WCP95_11390 [Actinomycetes bacterium]